MNTKNKSRSKSKENPFFLKNRFYLILIFILILILILLLKLASLQLIDPDRLIDEGDKRSIRHQDITVPRAMILDRNGRALAVSVPMFDVWADPKIIMQSGGFDLNDIKWREFSKMINFPINDLERKLNNSSFRFIYLAKQITPTTADYLKKLKLPGIHFDKTSKRYYPAGEIIAQLIGLTNIDNGDEYGAEGIEKSYNDWLTGEAGQRVIRRDRFGRVIEELRSTKKEQANDLVLSIDERLQTITYNELSKAVAFNKAESGTAVLIDIKTGEILAMATNPSYNPNNRSQINPNYLRNRAITDAFEPGSTVKPLVVMKALNDKIADLNTVIDTRPFYVNRYEVKDVSYQKSLNIAGILEKSSNVGVSKLALQMVPSELVEFYSRFGFGRSTGLGIGGESSGTIAENRKRWSDIERATFSFGYGLMVTPLQLARAYATIGSYGVYRPVSILKTSEQVKGNRIIDEEIAKIVVHLMKDVATNGGGKKASVPGFSVAVKTGTAKKLGSNGKYIKEYIAYTAGIAPAKNPRYSLVVLIDNPKGGQYYGGTVSGPVFSKIMGSVLRTMNIEPDDESDNQMIVH